jgi:ATP phosphoribosyltransferase
MQKKLKIAIQKSGRLSENSLKLLKECGIDIDNGLNKLKTEASNFPIEVFFLRDDDIPQYVADGVADIGIVGENVLLEKNKNLKEAINYASAQKNKNGAIGFSTKEADELLLELKSKR